MPFGYEEGHSELNMVPFGYEEGNIELNIMPFGHEEGHSELNMVPFGLGILLMHLDDALAHIRIKLLEFWR